jgi:hypothetical protein
MDDRIIVRYRRVLGHGESSSARREILFRDVASISRSDTTSISYTALIITTSSGERQFFTLAPESGSGWRGSSEDETENVLSRIKELIEAQN